MISVTLTESESAQRGLHGRASLAANYPGAV